MLPRRPVGTSCVEATSCFFLPSDAPQSLSVTAYLCRSERYHERVNCIGLSFLVKNVRSIRKRGDPIGKSRALATSRSANTASIVWSARVSGTRYFSVSYTHLTLPTSD